MAGDDAKLERITDLILALLDAPRPIPLSQLSEEIPGYPEGHEARRQAFERDKRLLREEGIIVESVPIDGVEQFGYRIDPATFFLPDLGLDDAEQAALNLAVAGVQFGDDLGGDALRKLGIVELNNVQHIAALGVVPGLDRLFQGIAAGAEVRFLYRGEQRTVSPARLRFVDGHWYLSGWSKERLAGRNYRVDRIEGDVTIGAPGSGNVSDEERVTLDLPDGKWDVEDESELATSITVLVDSLYAARVASEVGNEHVLATNEDGSLVLTVVVPREEVARSWILSLLDHAVVLEPASFREGMVTWLEGVRDQPASKQQVPRIEDLNQGVAAPPPARSVPPAQQRVRRLLAMLEWLASVGSASTSDMATRFSMSEEEVVAELELAACCGRPPYSPAELMDIIVDPDEVSARLPEMSRPRQLTTAEGVAIAAAARTILAMPGADESGPLARAVVKLDAALGKRPAIEIDLPSPPLLEEITQATTERHQLEVEYLALSSDELTLRTIDPLRVIALDGRWYVQAFCYRANALRTFRVDAFQRINVKGPQPDAPRDLPSEPERFLPSADATTVFVRVSPRALWIADSIPIEGRRDESDGGATIAVSVSGRSWFERILLQAGQDAQVLGPEEWVPLPSHAAKRILEQY